MTGSASTLLAFDYGQKRIGVAVGQSLTGTATPLQTILVKNNRPDWPAITKLVETWSPDALVVGLPLNMDGSEQDMSDQARRFSRKLHGRFHLPVHLADERLSTREARSRTAGRGCDADAVAAQVILEGWLASPTVGVEDPR